jgi:hypothetical protein
VYDAYLVGEDRILCSSKMPFLDAARVLLNDGIATPDDILVMRHAGSDVNALSAPAGVAAKLTIEEREISCRPPRFVRWKPFEVTAVMARIEESRRKEEQRRPPALTLHAMTAAKVTRGILPLGGGNPM